MHQYIYIKIYTLRAFQIFEVSCGSYLYKGTLTFILLPLLNCDLFHVECPDPGHFVTSQLRPFHVECPDPGHMAPEIM